MTDNKVVGTPAEVVGTLVGLRQPQQTHQTILRINKTQAALPKRRVVIAIMLLKVVVSSTKNIVLGYKAVRGPRARTVVQEPRQMSVPLSPTPTRQHAKRDGPVFGKRDPRATATEKKVKQTNLELPLR